MDFICLDLVLWLEQTPNSSILVWRIPGTGEPGGLRPIGLQSWTQLSDLARSTVHLGQQGKLRQLRVLLLP